MDTQQRPTTEEESPTVATVDLYWIPLGPGAHVVRMSGKLFEAISARLHRRRSCDLYHSALVVAVPDGRFVIEQTPVPRAKGSTTALSYRERSEPDSPDASGSSATRSDGGETASSRTWRTLSRVRCESQTTSPEPHRSSTWCLSFHHLSGVETNATPARCGTRTR
jgi:hypothetical protein